MKNTEKLLSFEEVKKNREMIVPRISEGSKELEDIINFCLDNNIPTIACCKGHKLTDSPYITMTYNQNTYALINAFLKQLSDIKNIKIMFATTGFTENPFNVTIYTQLYNRDKVFSIISNSLKNKQKEENLPSSLNLALRIALNFDYRLEYATVTILNQQWIKKYMIGLFGQHGKDTILDTYKDSKKIQKSPFPMSYYLYRNPTKMLNIAQDYEELHEYFKYSNGFMIKADSPIKDKIIGIDTLNKHLEDTYGSIRRPM